VRLAAAWLVAAAVEGRNAPTILEGTGQALTVSENWPGTYRVERQIYELAALDRIQMCEMKQIWSKCQMLTRDTYVHRDGQGCGSFDRKFTFRLAGFIGQVDHCRGRDDHH
jgi:hypothetical protein